ncbi:hypothetical protein CY0110_18312 [Crocosphaera chwakensis CCY0110]|uniref:Uncharacterized protein n=1 Tax=Crocosphaera chwakensis CCY0110 TaxID=391612 RepID=A3IIZ4_9CHRO|nr:hypothetical protein CY0110_18312 [Crocosphaera chwakensis CCY0110]
MYKINLKGTQVEMKVILKTSDNSETTI